MKSNVWMMVVCVSSLIGGAGCAAETESENAADLQQADEEDSGTRCTVSANADGNGGGSVNASCGGQNGNSSWNVHGSLSTNGSTSVGASYTFHF
jgi:hypothetical protein